MPCAVPIVVNDVHRRRYRLRNTAEGPIDIDFTATGFSIAIGGSSAFNSPFQRPVPVVSPGPSAMPSSARNMHANFTGSANRRSCIIARNSSKPESVKNNRGNGSAPSPAASSPRFRAIALESHPGSFGFPAWHYGHQPDGGPSAGTSARSD